MKKIFKKIYNLLPLKRQLFSLLQIFWTPPYSVYRHLHFTGNMTVKVNRASSFIMYSYGDEIENKIFGMDNGRLGKEINEIMGSIV